MKEERLTWENWDEIDRKMLQAGVYTVYDEVAELQYEENRYWYL